MRKMRPHALVGLHPLFRNAASAMTTASAPDKLSLRAVILRVFLPFALGYFLSYLFRSVNAVISPYLREEVGLTAGDLGLLTSAYFLAFAAAQLPIGLGLDRMGPRKVEGVLLIFAALGAGLFALAESVGILVAARALIGLGVAACLMAALKAMTQWFPLDKLPLVNGIVVASGGVGALVATAPTEWAVEAIGWRAVFFVLAGATVVAAVIIFAVVPDRKRTTDTPEETLGQAMGKLGVIFKSRAFWRIAPAVAMNQGGFMAIQGLWAGPWLRDVAGLPKDEAASVLLFIAVAMVAGQIGIGLIVERLGRFGISTLTVVAVCMGGFIGTEVLIAWGWTAAPLPLWMAFGFLGTVGIVCYAMLSRQFSTALAGRSNTSVNLTMFLAAFAFQWGIGAIIDLWPMDAEGRYPTEAYGVAIGAVVVLQAIAWVWLIVPRRQS